MPLNNSRSLAQLPFYAEWPSRPPHEIPLVPPFNPSTSSLSLSLSPLLVVGVMSTISVMRSHAIENRGEARDLHSRKHEGRAVVGEPTVKLNERRNNRFRSIFPRIYFFSAFLSLHHHFSTLSFEGCRPRLDFSLLAEIPSIRRDEVSSTGRENSSNEKTRPPTVNRLSSIPPPFLSLFFFLLPFPSFRFCEFFFSRIDIGGEEDRSRGGGREGVRLAFLNVSFIVRGRKCWILSLLRCFLSRERMDGSRGKSSEEED